MSHCWNCWKCWNCWILVIVVHSHVRFIPWWKMLKCQLVTEDIPKCHLCHLRRSWMSHGDHSHPRNQYCCINEYRTLSSGSQAAGKDAVIYEKRQVAGSWIRHRGTERMTFDNSAISAMTNWHFSNFSKSGHLLKLLKLLKCQLSHCWNVNQSSKIVILTYVDIVWCLWEMIMKSLLHFGALALRENVTAEKNSKHFETQWKSRKIIVSNPIRSKTILYQNSS